MKIDEKKAATWLQEVALSLPRLDEVIAASSSEFLLIGASVFDIYASQGWIPPLKRKTGDLDLSIGLVSGEEDYAAVKGELLKRGYENRDAERRYRFHPPKIRPGALNYVDVLAHSNSRQVSENTARVAMGVEAGFSLSGMGFARQESFRMSERLFCPNPVAMVLLKRTAYLDDPVHRLKDLADIAELAWGIVERGTHFELESLWDRVKGAKEARTVRDTLQTLGGGESVEWDLEEARQELLKRGFTASDVETAIPARLTEWASFLA